MSAVPPAPTSVGVCELLLGGDDSASGQSAPITNAAYDPGANVPAGTIAVVLFVATLAATANVALLTTTTSDSVTPAGSATVNVPPPLPAAPGTYEGVGSAGSTVGVPSVALAAYERLRPLTVTVVLSV